MGNPRVSDPAGHRPLGASGRHVRGGLLPGFPESAPEASVVGFEEELEHVRATPTEVVHKEVRMLMQAEKDHIGPVSPKKEHMLEIYLGNPDDSLKRLVNALRRYHDLAIAPYRPRIQEHREGDTQLGSNRGSPNHGSTLLSKRVMAEIRSPLSVRTRRPVPWRMPPVGARR